MINLVNYLDNQTANNVKGISKDYKCIFSTTENKFFCSESGAAVNASRQWVQEWELFNIAVDPNSGDKLIQSKQTKKYAQVNKDNQQLFCTAASGVQEARFKIGDNGSIKAYNSQFVKTNGSGPVTANSSINVPFGIYPVKQVAIANEDRSMFARPSTIDDEPRLTMDSRTPVMFNIIIDDDNTCYIETQDFKFVYPINNYDPLTYAQTSIDVNTYRYTITPPTADKDYCTIFSKSFNTFVGYDESTTAKTVRVGYDNSEALFTHFQLVSM